MARVSAIGSYIFAGGFTLGVKRNCDVLAHLEGSDYGVDTFRTNNPNIPVHFPVENWPLKQYKGVDFVYANPPCAPWSSLGKHRWESDGRVECTKNVFNVLLPGLKPKVCASESVTQIFSRGRKLIDELTDKILSLGYSVTYLLHDTMWMGMAQSRRRFFLVAHRIEIPWEIPDFAKPVLTVAQVLKGVRPKYSPGELHENDIYKKLWAYTKPGDSLRDGFEAWRRATKAKEEKNHLGHVIGRPGFAGYRLCADRPCGAVTGGYILHWKEDRKMAFNEMVKLNGYPDDYVWKCGVSARNGELARGVCPPVGEWLSRQVVNAVKLNKPERKQVHFIDIRNSPAVIENWTKDRNRTISISAASTSAPVTVRRPVKPIIEDNEYKRMNRSTKPAGRPRMVINDSRKIVIKVKDNPRRSETARKLFDLYRSCKTVGEFKQRAKEIHRSFNAYFNEDIEHGYIELVA